MQKVKMSRDYTTEDATYVQGKSYEVDVAVAMTWIHKGIATDAPQNARKETPKAADTAALATKKGN